MVKSVPPESEEPNAESRISTTFVSALNTEKPIDFSSIKKEDNLQLHFL